LTQGIKTTIYVDHLTTMRFCNEILRSGTVRVLEQSPGRQTLRWFGNVMNARRDIMVVHQQAHTKDRNGSADLNRRADELAKEARDSAITITTPEEYMGTFALPTAQTGITHAHPPQVVREVWQAKYTTIYQQTRNETRFYSKRMFTTATPAASAQVQLMIQSAQLATPRNNLQRGMVARGNSMVSCRDCKAAQKDVDHQQIFVNYPGELQQILERHKDEAVRKVKEHMVYKKQYDTTVIKAHVRLAKVIYYDKDMWIGGKTDYWWGSLPKDFLICRRP
jgi:uncharacterized protein (DUF2267 family)